MINSINNAVSEYDSEPPESSCTYYRILVLLLVVHSGTAVCTRVAVGYWNTGTPVLYTYSTAFNIQAVETTIQSSNSVYSCTHSARVRVALAPE